MSYAASAANLARPRTRGNSLAISRRALRSHPGVLVVLLLVAGCAWFEQPPYVPVAGPPPVPPQQPPAAPADSAAADSAAAAAPDSAFAGEPETEARDSAAADSAGAEDVPGEELWTVTGTSLDARTEGGEQVLFVTAPVITHRDAVLTAREGTYYRGQESARMVEDVRFTEGTLTATSDLATYDRASGTLIATGRVFVADDSLQVRADRGIYRRTENVLELYGDVEGIEGPRNMRSDAATWDRAAGTMLLDGGAVLRDPERNSTVTGESILYDLATERALVRGTPQLAVRPGEEGAMRITGRRLWLERSGDARAAEEVVVRRGLVTGFADSAAFFRDDRLGILLGAPRVEERNGTLLGDTLYLRFDEDESLRQVDVHGRAFVRYAPQDSAKRGEVSIIEGDSLTMYFQDTFADRIVVFGSAKSSYVPAPTDESDAGTNVARGDTITIFLDEGEVSRMVVTGNAQGIYTFGKSRDERGPPGADADSAAADGAAASSAMADSVLADSPAAGSTMPDSVMADSAAAGAAVPPDSVDAAGRDAARRAEIVAALGDSAVAAAVGLLDSLDVFDAPVDTTRERLALVPEARGREQVKYSAERVEFVLADRTVDLLGNSQIDYGTLTLTAGKVRFHADERYLDASEDPKLVDRGDGAREVVGERMDYNLRSGEGTIDEGRTQAEDGFVYAERLRQLDDGDYLAKDGNSTTCELAEKGEDPHYHFGSKQMRIYLKDKVVARPVVLYIRDIPVFALPFYVFSIRKGRHSGFLTPDLDFGLGSTQGRFFRNLGYYWAASEYWDLAASADYQEKPSRFTANLKVNYAKRYLMSGRGVFRQSFGENGETLRDISADHEMTLGAWRLTGRAEFRDRAFRQQEPLGQGFDQRLDRFLLSDVSVSRPFDWGGSFSASLSRREDLDATFDDGRDEEVLRETLPTYTFSLSPRTIGKEPDRDGSGGRWPALSTVRWSFRSNGSTTRVKRERTRFVERGEAEEDSSLFSFDDERTTAARHSFSLSDRRKFLGVLNAGPSFEATESWVDREFSLADTVKGFRRALTWSAGVSGGTTLFGTFPGLGPVVALRHTMSPNASFSYRPAFRNLSYRDTLGVERARFPGVSSFEQKVLRLSLDNAFQAKVRGGEGIRRVELFNWNLGTSYDFNAKEDGRDAWSDVNSTVNLNRIAGVNVSFSSDHDPYRGLRFQRFQASGGFSLRGMLPGGDAAPAATDEEGASASSSMDRRGGDTFRDVGRIGPGPSNAGALGWSANFGVTYSGSRIGDRMDTNATIRSSLALKITRNWSIDYNNTWNVADGRIVGEGFTLRRDLHCWEASFSGSRLVDDTTFYIVINVKTMPDVKFEQGRRGTDFGGLTGFLP